MSRTRQQQIESLAARLRRLQAQEREARRKADAHKKIKLGGVVIAAGLDEVDPAVLAGILTHAKPMLEKPETVEAFRQRGAALLKR